jgi:hypothetical protein
MAVFRWNRKRELAALLVARDEIRDRDLCERVGISESTLYNWKAAPEFAARVESHVAAFRVAIRRHGIALLERRVAAYS